MYMNNHLIQIMLLLESKASISVIKDKILQIQYISEFELQIRMGLGGQDLNLIQLKMMKFRSS